jgi:hypothetical protein
MAGQKDMLEALAALDATRVQVLALGRDQPEGWKLRHVGARREVQTQLARVNQVAHEWLVAQGDTPDSRRLRELLGTMRNLVAEHQTRWPVVTVDTDDPTYRVSMAKLDAALKDARNFIQARMAV